MYLGPPCYVYALNCHLVYLAIPGARPSCMKKQNLLVLIICNHKKRNSNKHETGLVHGNVSAHASEIVTEFLKKEKSYCFASPP